LSGRVGLFQRLPSAEYRLSPFGFQISASFNFLAIAIQFQPQFPFGWKHQPVFAGEKLFAVNLDSPLKFPLGCRERVKSFEVLPKTFTDLLNAIVKILEIANAKPFLWITVSFSLRAFLTNPECGWGWVDDGKAGWMEKKRSVGPIRIALIDKKAKGVRLDSQNLVGPALG
jgi:hypothetical protein